MTDARLDKQIGETSLAYHKRLVEGKLVDKSLSDFDYSELSEAVYGKPYSSDVARRMMYGSLATLKLVDEDSSNKRVDESSDERKKIQTANYELNKMLRDKSRDDMLIEQVINAANSIVKLPTVDYVPRQTGVREAVLVFGDEHYGSEFTLYGIDGSIINEYSPSIAKHRMGTLLSRVIDIVQRENVPVVHVYNIGDFTDGVLRVGQLKKLATGVVDSTIEYAEYISNWLNTLSKYVFVSFQMVHGNHSELRMLGQPKGTFKDENMGKIVAAWIKTRLKDNGNFEFIDNPSGLIFDNVCGFNILGIHGEVKNMSNAIRDLSFEYKTSIDYLLAGHLHHLSVESDGYRRQAIRVPSIVGTDDYALSLHKISDPGAIAFIVEQDVGKTVEYTIYL